MLKMTKQILVPDRAKHIPSPHRNEIMKGRLDQRGHELFEAGLLIGFDRIHFDTEFLATGPANDRAVHKDGRVLTGEKDTECDNSSEVDRMRPIDAPAVEGEIPSDTASLEGIAGVID